MSTGVGRFQQQRNGPITWILNSENIMVQLNTEHIIRCFTCLTSYLLSQPHLFIHPFLLWCSSFHDSPLQFFFVQSPSDANHFKFSINKVQIITQNLCDLLSSVLLMLQSTIHYDWDCCAWCSNWWCQCRVFLVLGNHYFLAYCWYSHFTHSAKYTFHPILFFCSHT